MKALACCIGIGGLLFGAFYGFASSPNYVKILSYSLACEAASIAAFGYCFFKSTGLARWFALLACILALLVVVQAVIRLVRILSS